MSLPIRKCLKLDDSSPTTAQTRTKTNRNRWLIAQSASLEIMLIGFRANSYEKAEWEVQCTLKSSILWHYMAFHNKISK